MDECFEVLAADHVLAAAAKAQLRESGFIVIPGPVPPEQMSRFAGAYDSAVASAAATDIAAGRTSTRVADFVNRGAVFDSIYTFKPILEACCRVIGQAFKLSVLHARTLKPKAPAGDLHADFWRDADGFPMVGFILMIDAFRPDNGATRFVPGSHRWPAPPEDVLQERTADHDAQVLACGSAGSLIVYNGAVWHSHSANLSDTPRRSIQGAYIRRTARSGGNLPERMTAETLARISPRAKYLLAV